MLDEISGAVDATTFRVSSQVALLPGTQNRVIAFIQNGQLGATPEPSSPRSTAIHQSQVQPARTMPRWSYRTIDQQEYPENTRLLDIYLRNAPIYALSVDACTGQRIPVQQYMAQQIFEQFRNSMGSLAAASRILELDPVHQRSLQYRSRCSEADAEQMNDAVATITNQVGYNLALFPSNLHLFPNSRSNLITTLNDLFYGSQTPGNGAITTNAGARAPGFSGHRGRDPGSARDLPESLQLPGTVPTNPAVSAPTSTTHLITPTDMPPALGSYFGLSTPSTGYTLGAGPYSSMYSPNYYSFGNGFNTGYGIGYTGLGGYPTYGYNNFGTGYNGIMTNGLSSIGYTPSVFSGFGLGLGTGTGLFWNSPEGSSGQPPCRVRCAEHPRYGQRGPHRRRPTEI